MTKEDEKAWQEYWGELPETDGYAFKAEHVKDAYIAGRASRDSEVNKLRGLVQCLIDNDPYDDISDGGHIVLDLWRHDARKALKGDTDAGGS